MNNSLLKFAKDLNILYVEDDTFARETALTVLKNYFDKITTCDNGAEGLKEYKSNSFDIVITDIYMPILNGTKMIEEIRKHDDKQIIIVLSSEDDFEETIKLIDLRINFFIKKPLKKDDIEEKISKAIRAIAINRFDNEHSEYIHNSLKKKISKLIEELTRKNQIIDFIYANTNEGHGIIDINGNFQNVSAVLSEILGYNQRELKRLSCMDLTDPDYVEITKRVLSCGLEKKVVRDFVKVCNTKSGTKKTISMSIKLQENGNAFFVLIKEIKNPTKEQLKNSHIPFQNKEKPTNNAQDFIDRTINIDGIINKFEALDDELELAINRMTEENISEVSKIFYKLAEIILSMGEFGSLYDGILELSNALNGEVEIKSIKHLKDFLFGISDSIYQWRRGMFIDKNLEDIHFYDNSIIGDCLQTKSYITKHVSSDDDNDELELF